MNESGLFTLDNDKYAAYLASDGETYNLFSCVFNNEIAYIRMDGYVISEIVSNSDAVDAAVVVNSHFTNVKTLKDNGMLKGTVQRRRDRRIVNQLS